MHDWLSVAVSVEEAEASNTWDGVPFGMDSANWTRLKSLLLADSQVQLRFFSSPPETWTTFPRRGWEGYAAVKNGKIIEFLLTAIS